MLNWLRRLLGPPGEAPPPPGRPRVRATYDAAATTDENQRHWVHTDGLSARRANSPDVRKRLRERARYEVSNNSYALGIVNTLANHLVGDGPRLQMQTGDEAIDRAVESRWADWAHCVRLPDKLRTAKRAKTVDGEGVGLLVHNPRLDSPVKLDVLLVECDQMADLFADPTDLLAVDGLRFDEWGNVVEYRFLPHHPGDWWAGPRAVRKVEPHNVLHWFRRDRPGQWRGVPEVTSALGLFGQLRRFTLATLTAAETAASFAALLQSPAPANTEERIADPFESLSIERGMMTQLPDGMTMAQLKAEHPTTTYETFVWCLLREICRCLQVPLNIALGDSSRSNYSSARLDHLVYRQAVRVEREDCEREVLAPAFRAWLREASRVPGCLPSGVGKDRFPAHAWHWPAWEPIDQKAEAEADEIRLRAGTATLPQIAGEHGRDWRQMVAEAAQVERYREQVAEELAPDVAAQAGASNDLRATVGGLQAIAELQRAVYAGEIPRAAAIANAVLLFGFAESEAQTLFPEVAPENTADPGAEQGGGE